MGGWRMPGHLQCEMAGWILAPVGRCPCLHGNCPCRLTVPLLRASFAFSTSMLANDKAFPEAMSTAVASCHPVRHCIVMSIL